MCWRARATLSKPADFESAEALLHGEERSLLSESLENAAGLNHTPATHFVIFGNLRLSHDSWSGVCANNLGSGHLARGKGFISQNCQRLVCCSS